MSRASDGQVTLGSVSRRGGGKKVHLAESGNAIMGFAGGVADAMALSERLETKLEAYPGNVRRAAVELGRDWRTDRMLRRLEALLIVADKEASLIITGNGDVIEPEDSLMAIGSGGSFALSAARALYRHTELDAKTIVQHSLGIAADICVYTNQNHTIEELEF